MQENPTHGEPVRVEMVEMDGEVVRLVEEDETGVGVMVMGRAGTEEPYGRKVPALNPHCCVTRRAPPSCWRRMGAQRCPLAAHHRPPHHQPGHHGLQAQFAVVAALMSHPFLNKTTPTRDDTCS